MMGRVHRELQGERVACVKDSVTRAKRPNTGEVKMEVADIAGPCKAS